LPTPAQDWLQAARTPTAPPRSGAKSPREVLVLFAPQAARNASVMRR
jgi:hypothetical protein